MIMAFPAQSVRRSETTSVLHDIRAATFTRSGWKRGSAIITLVSFRTGDASLYFSTGAVIIGGGQHAKVAETSKAFVNQAESLLREASSTDTALMTEPGMLKFYLLTTKRKYTIRDKIDNVYNQTSKLSGLFANANELISAIRKVTPDR